MGEVRSKHLGGRGVEGHGCRVAYVLNMLLCAFQSRPCGLTWGFASGGSAWGSEIGAFAECRQGGRHEGATPRTLELEKTSECGSGGGCQ